MTYDLIITLEDNQSISQLYSERLYIVKNNTWTKHIYLKPDRYGINMKLNFGLYADGNLKEPYRECRLWINVSN
jgi:uncharacterized membrane protein